MGHYKKYWQITRIQT